MARKFQTQAEYEAWKEQNRRDNIEAGWILLKALGMLAALPFFIIFALVKSTK